MTALFHELNACSRSPYIGWVEAKNVAGKKDNACNPTNHVYNAHFHTLVKEQEEGCKHSYTYLTVTPPGRLVRHLLLTLAPLTDGHTGRHERLHLRRVKRLWRFRLRTERYRTTLGRHGQPDRVDGGLWCRRRATSALARCMRAVLAFSGDHAGRALDFHRAAWRAHARRLSPMNCV